MSMSLFPDHAAEQGEEIEKSIQDALRDAERSGVSGRDVTPFVLAKLNEITGGKSLQANWALLENNAEVGAEIAVNLAEQSKDAQSKSHKIGDIIGKQHIINQTFICLDVIEF